MAQIIGGAVLASPEEFSEFLPPDMPRADEWYVAHRGVRCSCPSMRPRFDVLKCAIKAEPVSMQPVEVSWIGPIARVVQRLYAGVCARCGAGYYEPLEPRLIPVEITAAARRAATEERG